MKLLLDQDVYGVTARFLIDLGHDVLRVSEIGMAAANDDENLNKALETWTGIRNSGQRLWKLGLCQTNTDRSPLFKNVAV